MANIAVQELRAGTTFVLDGQPFMVQKYEHIKMGRGSATIRVRGKNLLTGTILDKSFINSAKVEEIDTIRRPMQYLYQDGKDFVFMDPKTYEQVTLPGDVVGESAPYLTEEVQVIVLFWDQRPLWIELPPKMQFTVSQTDPGVKGNSVSNMFKQAVLENGLNVKVPLFIKEGDGVVVDTRDGSYVERAK